MYRLNETIWSLSTAIDYVGITDTYHCKLVAYYATQILSHLDSDLIYDDAVFSALLHDCGVTKNETHEKLVSTLYCNELSAHCMAGASLISKQPLLSHLTSVIFHHHTPANELPSNLSPNECLLANLIFLADRIDVLIGKSGEQPDKYFITKTITSNKHHLFLPELIDAFQRASKIDCFWFVRTDSDVYFQFSSWIRKRRCRLINIFDLERLSLLFASCVDKKSEFTAEHSIGTRNLSVALSRLANISDENLLHKIAIAGLLHDLGKLRVPDNILSKNQKLDENEMVYIKRHSFDSMKLLNGIKGLDDISIWVGQHHEKLNGTGYPFQLSADQIPIESRIIALSDIFQAIAQKRPYRTGNLNKNDIINIISSNSSSGQTDPHLSEIIISNYDYLYEVATHQNVIAIENI